LRQGSKTQVHKNCIHNWASELIKLKPVRLLKDGYKVTWFPSVSLSLRYLERCGPIHHIFFNQISYLLSLFESLISVLNKSFINLEKFKHVEIIIRSKHWNHIPR
jgi:hypothetical protein